LASYLIVVNPASGRGRAQARAEALRSGLVASETVEVVTTRGRGDASEVVARRGLDFDRVLAVGGDGTLNEVLSGLIATGAPARALPALGFLPSGTANVAAPAFGLGTDPAAVAASLPLAPERLVDVGLAIREGAERPFLLWLGAGYDAVIIRALNAQRTGLMGAAGLARKAPGVLRAIHRYSAPEIRVSEDGETGSTWASAMVANVGSVAFGGTITRAADPFDGEMELVVVPQRGTARIALLAMRLMVGSLDGARDVRRGRTTRVRLESGGTVPLQLDGEPVGTLPVEVRVLPGAVRLVLT